LRGKTVLITGASKGIGLAAAAGFAAEGCNVHLAARTGATLEQARDSLAKRFDVRVTIHPLDLSESRAQGALAKACPDPDILVNNAGAIPGGDLSAVDEARWRKAWDLKVFGYVNLTRAYYAVMKARRHGVIVNVVGLAGERPDFRYVAGTAGNAALMAFSRAMGSMSLDDGIRVVAVNPGAVETDRIVTLWKTRAEKEFGDVERWREYQKRLPLGRAAKAEEVADLIVFAASGRASYISGVVLTIDGGSASRAGAF
jgi:3-oxoacyl-[acyl-carrier protein] reductase